MRDIAAMEFRRLGRSLRLSVAMITVAAVAVAPPQASSSPAWEDGKAYTAMLKDAAEVAAAAVGAAAAAVVAATRDLANARAAFNNANTAAATTAATLAAVAKADAALAAATSALAAAEATAAATAAVAAGATVGTLIGQGLRGLWTLCWDPVCTIRSVNIGANPIYRPATIAEVEALVPQLVAVGAGVQSVDFDNTGAAGDASKAFIVGGARMFLDAARAAAAFTAGRNAEVRSAIPDLQSQLFSYRSTIETFANVLAGAAVVSPVSALNAAFSAFETARAEMLAACNSGGGDNCAALDASFGTMRAQILAVLDAMAQTDFGPLVGGADAFYPRLTLDRFLAFLDDAAMLGSAALPPAEIALMDLLLAVADLQFPGQTSFGPLLASYDAMGDIGGREAALFDPVTRDIDLARLLLLSSTLRSGSGAWLNIDLADSPVTRAVNAAEPAAAGLLAVGLVAVLRRRLRTSRQ